MGAQVALGELAVMAALGLPLIAYLSRSRLLSRLTGAERRGAAGTGAGR